MVYITGEVRDYYEHFRPSVFSEQIHLGEADFVIVCGGLGYETKPEIRDHQIELYQRKPYTTLYISGKDYDPERLSRYEVIEFCGGKARRIHQKLIHLMRGELYNIDGKTFFTMGGDCTVNSSQTDMSEYKKAMSTLENAGLIVDYVLSYRPPETVRLLLQILGLAGHEKNSLTCFLEDVKERIQYQKWYCGCYHLDSKVFGEFFSIHKNIHPLPK